MHKPILTVAMAMAMLSAGAQINSPQAAGYLARGEGMELTSNYLGAIDQLTHLEQLSADVTAERAARYGRAMSAFERRQSDARALLEEYLSAYPAGGERMVVKLAIADCDFIAGHYASALAAYNQLRMDAFDSSNAATLCFHRGFCLLKVGEYDKAMAEFGRLDRSVEYGNAARFYQGYATYAKGDYRRAEELLKSVDTATSPGNMADAYLSQIYYLRGDYGNALRCARSVLNNQVEVPDEFRSEAMRVAGESLYHQGDLNDALTYLNGYVAAVDRPLPSTLYILGLTEYKQRKYDDAIAALTTVADQPDAMGQSAYLLIGQSYMKLGNVNAATMALDKAAQMDFDRTVAETAFYNYAIARTNGGRVPFGNSVATFEEFLQRYPGSQHAAEVQDYIVTGYLTDNDYESALRSILRIKKPTANTLVAKQHVLYTLGTREYEAGDAVRAEVRFVEAKLVGDYNKDVARECDLWIGDCQYAQGKYDLAAKSYLEYLNGLPATAPNRAMGYYNLGYARFQAKKYGDAAVDFQRYIDTGHAQSPALIADAYNRLGDCQYYEHKYEQALHSYDLAYEAAPEAGDYSLFQCGMMAGAQRQYKGKVTSMQKMLTDFPSSSLVPDALLQMAQAQTEMNDLKGALATYRQLAATYPGTEQGREGKVLMGVTQSSLGDNDAAVATYKEVVSDYPSSAQALLAVDNLKEIYATEGNIDQLAKYLASVEGAPQLEASEMETLTFESAEKEYDNSGKTKRLEAYVEAYPNERNAARAYGYLLASALESNNDAEVLRYATIIVDKYPDSRAVEDALLAKGDIEMKQGKGERALNTYSRLEQRASTPDMQAEARMGMLKVNARLGRYDQVVSLSEKLLATAATGINRDDVTLERGLALAKLGKTEKALAGLKPLAKKPTSLDGSIAAYTVAQIYYDQDKMRDARRAVEGLIDSNTPHNYWLARGFILLSDINRKEGNTFEADEYLRQLKTNYPGSEKDIFEMIDQRLK